MTWTTTQLTFGTKEGRFHSHSYYDVPVVEPGGARVLAYETRFAERQPSPDDEVTVGLASLDEPGRWQPVGATRAWSWQQGPMAQWIGQGRFAFNDRGDRADRAFIARLFGPGGEEGVLDRPLYAVAPKNGFGLSLNMARLEALRPGYGYAGGTPDAAADRQPREDGVWRVPLDGGAPELILSLSRAVAALRERQSLKDRLRHKAARYAYWFNHAKLSPSERRFTVKLRWRRPGGPWNGRMGVSLTCNADGTDLRVLTDETSHVMWLGEDSLYAWRRGELAVFADEPGGGRRTGILGGGAIDANVHLRHLPPGGAEAQTLIYDTPYREEIDLYWQDAAQDRQLMARFTGHLPPRGPFRCDLHPVPLPGGEGALVTSLQDGGRQLYAVRREDGNAA